MALYGMEGRDSVNWREAWMVWSRNDGWCYIEQKGGMVLQKLEGGMM